jgi:TonB family protein
MRFLLYPVFVVICSSAFAQVDTVYLNAELKKSVKEQASSYLVYEKLGEWKYKASRFDMQGRIKETGEYSSVDPVTQHGAFTEYDTTGAKSGEGAYVSGKRNGFWKEYYKGTTQVHAERNYDFGKSVGELKSYYPDGKLKREEYNKADGSVSGKCYNVAGEEMKFTPYEQMPQFNGSMAAYIGENLKYPELCMQNNIQGRVIVKFAVDEKGRVTNAQVTKSVHALLDKEALRIVNNMPAWKPGKEDDTPVKVHYTIPISFRFTD